MDSTRMGTSEENQRLDEVITAYLKAVESGQAPDRQDLLARHPELAAELAEFFQGQDQMDRLVRPLRDASLAGQTMSRSDDLANATTLAPGEKRQAGTRISYFGDYELIEEIARGGMGVIYRARQVSLNRIVALKMILAGQLASAAEVQRFHMEAEAAGNLDHPNIVPIYEVGEHQGQHYFSMKLVEGGSLAQMISACRFPIADFRSIVRMFVQVAKAVHYAHQRGILHRDLKPANILLQNPEPRTPMVTDFGLAKKMEADSSMTQTGAILGTPSYMAPEQASGQKGGVTTLVDLFSLGAILYELLTGRPPFRGETPLETIKQVQEHEPAPPSKLNPRVDRNLETICLKCLQKNPQERYPSAGALAEDLEHWLAGEPITARPPSIAFQIWSWLRKNVRVAVWTVVITVLCTALAITPVINLSMMVLFQNAQRTYEYFPSLQRPWLLSFDWRAPSTWREHPAFVVPSIVIGIAAIALMGLFVVLVVKPRDRWSDIGAGISSGIVCGITSFLMGVSQAVLLALVVVPQLQDMQLLAHGCFDIELQGEEEMGPIEPAAEQLLRKYPDLASMEPEHRVRIFSKIIADMVVAVFMAVWHSFFGCLVLAVGVVVCQTMAAGYVVRSRQRWHHILFPYLELSVPAALLYLLIAGPFVTLAPPELQIWSAGALLTLAILTLLVVVGVRLHWPWPLRTLMFIVAVTIWGRSSGISGINYIPIPAHMLLYIALAALAVHYYHRFRRTLPEGVSMLSDLRMLKSEA